MKKNITKLRLIAVLMMMNLLFSLPIHAQNNFEKIPYQTIIRDVSNETISNQSVGVQISILQGSTSGSSIYTEVQTSRTNSEGLINLEIGKGSSNDDFSAINWENKPFFIKLEMDPSGGVEYSITNISQLVSLPSTGSEKRHYLGEEFDGGVIYHIYIGTDGKQHGLIIAKTEQDAQWKNNKLPGEDEDQGFDTRPAEDYIKSLGEGWYLPSIDELSKLWYGRYYVNNTLRSNGSTPLSITKTYWSRTEYNESSAYAFFFMNGSSGEVGKHYEFSVRPIRYF